MAELHVQTLVQDDKTPLDQIDAALRKSEHAQTAVRLEGLRTLRAAEAVLKPDQRRKMTAMYPHGRRRLGDPLPYL